MGPVDPILSAIPHTYTSVVAIAAFLLLAVSFLKAQVNAGRLTAAPLSTTSFSPSTTSTFILW